MYVVINEVTYTKIRNISFSTQVDITGDTVPVDRLDLDILTNDDIKSGQFIEMYDDLDQLWVRFWIDDAYVVVNGVVRIEAMHVLGWLDRFPMPPKFYSGSRNIQSCIGEVFGGIPSTIVPTIHFSSAWQDVSFSPVGYCPEQSARERLQWLLFISRGYCKQSFTNELYFDVINTDTVTNIPIEKTYWRPEVQYGDWVTAIRVYYYSWEKRAPVGDEEYVEVDGETYVYTESLFEFQNQNASANVAPNIIEISGLYLINEDIVAGLASRLALLYFNRISVDADIINNREFAPPQKVEIILDETHTATGYIDTLDFSFGVQAKSRMQMIGSHVGDAYVLIISYTYAGQTLSIKKYYIPSYQYNIQNPYIDKKSATHRYIYRPVNEYATGIMDEPIVRQDEPMQIALHWYNEDKVLHVISVSDIEYDSEDKVLEIG